MKILLSGMLAGVPRHGGATWAVLQYLLGFKRLGHQVCFVEPVAPSAAITCADDLRMSQSGRYFDAVCRHYGLESEAALLLADSRETVGLPYATLLEFAREADVLVNLSGMLAHEPLFADIPTRLYVDLDPGFTQLWAADGIDMGFDRHTHFATVGLNLGALDCPVPLEGRDWIRSAPPVVLEHWPESTVTPREAFTSVANWRGYGSVEHAGVFYGQKVHSYRRLIELPERAQPPLEVALAIHPDETADLALLDGAGWWINDPGRVSGTPWDYARYVAESRAELGVAKTGYTAGRTGWFSDRSAVYLASGRPVVAEDTGFSAWLPTGEGLLSFEGVDDAALAIEAVCRDYPRHRRAARRIAEEFLDSDKVLMGLLDAVAAPAGVGA